MTNLLEKHRTYILIIFMDYDMTCFNFMLLNEGFQSLWILVSLCTCTLFCFQIPMWRMNYLKNYLFYTSSLITIDEFFLQEIQYFSWFTQFKEDENVLVVCFFSVKLHVYILVNC